MEIFRSSEVIGGHSQCIGNNERELGETSLQKFENLFFF